MREKICGRLSERVSCITPFLVMDVLEKAQRMEREGLRVIHLEVGEPDFDTPAVVNQAAKAALDAGHTHYTHRRGWAAGRAAVAAHYAARYGASVDPGQVVVTSGTSPALFMACSALFEPGDKVLLADPCYACYPNFVRFAGAQVVYCRAREENGYQLTPDDVRRAARDGVKAVFLNSPANPAGTLVPDETYAAAAAEGLWIVSDEIYHGLVYSGKERSALEFTERAVALNGFSKLYAMTGWRLGYCIVPPEFVRGLQCLCQNFFISANSVSQWAGLAALTQTAADQERMRAIYDQRRQYMLGRLRAMGFGIAVEPTGAFYVLANARFLGGDSLKLAYDILDKAHGGVTPGIDFGPGAEGCLRFSYANSLENIAEAMDRLEGYVRKCSRL